MDISHLNKDKVLYELWQAARYMTAGRSLLTPESLSLEESKELIESGQTFFDYIKGICVKIIFDGDEVLTSQYDQEYGKGAAEKAIKRVKITQPSGG